MENILIQNPTLGQDFGCNRDGLGIITTPTNHQRKSAKSKSYRQVLIFLESQLPEYF